jgi:hypothetical protein
MELSELTPLYQFLGVFAISYRPAALPMEVPGLSSICQFWVFLQGSALHYDMSLSQNSVSFVPSTWKKRLTAVFSIKSKVAVPKLKFWDSLI